MSVAVCCCLLWLRLGKITKSKWPNYKVNYKISLYRDPERRNSTIGSGGKPSSRHNRCKYGGCIPAIWEFDATLAHRPTTDVPTDIIMV